MSNKLSQKLEKILEMNLYWMDRNLVAAIISQYGGEDAFFQNAPVDACLKTTAGFTTDDEVVGFLARNKTLMLEHIAGEIAFEECGSCIEFIKDLVSNETPLTLDQVAEGLYDTNSEFHVTVARSIACFAANKLAYAYEDEKERDKLEVIILDNGWVHIKRTA